MSPQVQGSAMEVFADAQLIGDAVAHNCRGMSNHNLSLLSDSQLPDRSRCLVLRGGHKRREQWDDTRHRDMSWTWAYRWALCSEGTP